MKSRRASVRIDSGLNCVDSAVRMLEDEWRRHGDVHLESFWAEQNRPVADGGVDSLGVLAELVKTDLRRRFDAGQRPTVAEYLDRFPELAGADSRVLSLVYEEFCLCEERDGSADVDSFCDRYTDWKSSLESQLRYHRMISQAAGAPEALPRFPKAGEPFEEFELLSLLGKGGSSRVFLARDLSLGGKNVALKVTLDRGQEPKLQGQLEHPHIVPVNSVTYPAEGRLCGLSMPYQPGLPLDEIIKRVKPSRRPARALALWSALFSGPGNSINPGSESVPAPGAQALPQGDGWRGFPSLGTYSQGAAWIVMVLARALHYAHGRQIHHRDVKPANILLTINHGPQLLDFNLAESPNSADHAQAALRGGTLPYMAPEQIKAFLNPELWPSVGAGADIYSLGLVLRELLTGQMPDLPAKGLPAARAMNDLLDRRPHLDTAVRRFNSAIPPSLEAIVIKCLALEPRDRYTDAESLGKDLERFLNHQPLLEAGNPSRRERLANYWVRQRGKLARVGLAGVILLVVAASIARPVRDWLTPSYLSRSDFHSAVNHVEGGRMDLAKADLSAIVKSSPHACLAKFYLAFVHDADHATWDDADKNIREALSLPDAEQEVIEWAKKRPRFCRLLVAIAEGRIVRADELAQSYDRDEPSADKMRDRELRKPGYDLARKILVLAERLDPDSELIQRLLATTEELFGQHDEAFLRLTSVIEKLTADKSSSLDAIFFCRKLRGRIAFLGVEQKLDRGEKVDKGMTQRLDQALGDLRLCEKFLGGRDIKDRVLKQYRVMHDQASANLILAEVRIAFGKLREARTQLNTSSRLIDSMKSYRSNGLKVPEPTELTRRLEDLSKRLSSPDGIASSRSQQSPGPSSGNRVRSG